ncbi:MAG: lysophospholipid acyltransferase family protein [Bacteroidetes bacterium]|nr:lysophospholipid acyltransferase family protein [Bacteroidota bacterium]
MKLRKLKQDSLRFIGNYFLLSAVNVLCKTLRITLKNKKVIDELDKEGKNYVLAFWHGTMLLPWYINRRKNFAALISKSKDGELLAKILKHWKYEVVRGSSSTGGNVALGIMIDYARNKSSIAITPDGPRGPIHKMKAGAVITAKKSGLPLVLVGIGIKRKRILKSWDKFEIPGLFTKVNVVFSDFMVIDRNLSYNETSKMISNSEMKLNELQKEANIF